MSARAVDVLRSIDVVWEGVAFAPVVLVRMARVGYTSDQFRTVCDCITADLPTPFHVDLNASHIRRSAKRNRRQNRAARVARRRNR